MEDQYIINSSDLSSVADTIRQKTGKTEELSFPDGFNTAIAEIQTGGATAIEPYLEETYDSSGNLVDVKLHGYSSIRANMFSSSRITLTSLPEGITNIGSSAFSMCISLALTSLPKSLTNIGSTAFQYCLKLALTSLPEGITSLSYGVFQNCSGLIQMTLPESLTDLGSNTFANCTSLASVTFKGTPTKISYDSFLYCANLTTINVPWAEGAVANAPWGATNATINYNYTGE